MPDARAKGVRSRWVLTAVGRVRLTRAYRLTGGVGHFPADDHLGVRGYLTRGAERMATLAGLQRSFAHAQALLRELSGWALDDNTVRKLTHAAARRAGERRPERADATPFATAPGAVEVLVDAGKVNTLTGWRDVKLGLFLKRMAGAPASPGEWDRRDLPAPTARAVVAAVEDADRFGRRLRRESDRLGLTTGSVVTVLGDGAEWIWNLAAEHLPQASGVLDIYHLLEHIGEAMTGIGGGEEVIRGRCEAARRAVLSGGKAGLEGWLGGVFAEVPTDVPTTPLLALAGYVAKHPTRVGYADRLAAGRSIGSGAVEGAIKQLVNLRLKRTGARWRVDHVGPLVELIALSDSPEWHDLWTAA